MGMQYQNKAVQRSIAAQNTFTDNIRLEGMYNIQVGGSNWTAIVTLQRTFDGGSNWFDVATFTSPGASVGFEPESDVYYRLGVKTANYTSGTVICRLSQTETRT